MPTLADLARWDRTALELTHEARWEPLSSVLAVVSSWWVVLLVFALACAVSDLRSRTRPRATATAAVTVALAGLAVFVLKRLADRSRPPTADTSLEALVSIPASGSFPSGHAAIAFAAATAIALVDRRLRAPLLVAAATIACSRVYLGVHYWSDVLAGAIAGVAGALLVLALTRLVPRNLYR